MGQRLVLAVMVSWSMRYFLASRQSKIYIVPVPWSSSMAPQDPFLKMKRDVLARKDKSREGRIDSAIVRLIGLLNADDDYCTTSSCAGRIQLIAKASSRKDQAAWSFKTHDPADEEQLIMAARKPFAGELWFRQEGFILHVRCRDMEAAYALLDAGQRAGFKHSGITGRRNIVLEIRGSDAFDTIVGRDGGLIVEELYLRILTKIANGKLQENSRRIDRFELNVRMLPDRQRRCEAGNRDKEQVKKNRQRRTGKEEQAKKNRQRKIDDKKKKEEKKKKGSYFLNRSTNREITPTRSSRAMKPSSTM